MSTCDPLTREECCDGTPCATCPTEAQDALRHTVEVFSDVGDDYWMIRATSDSRTGVVTGLTLGHLRALAAAPPLSPTEQATVDRFEAAPDPYADEPWHHDWRAR